MRRTRGVKSCWGSEVQPLVSADRSLYYPSLLARVWAGKSCTIEGAALPTHSLLAHVKFSECHDMSSFQCTVTSRVPISTYTS